MTTGVRRTHVTVNGGALLKSHERVYVEYPECLRAWMCATGFLATPSFDDIAGRTDLIRVRSPFSILHERRVPWYLFWWAPPSASSLHDQNKCRHPKGTRLRLFFAADNSPAWVPRDTTARGAR